MSTWAADNWQVPIVVVFAYLLFCWSASTFMASRKALGWLKNLWVWWNFAFSIFSFCGAARLLPHLVGMLLHEGFRETVCRTPGASYGVSGASGLWTMLFIFSKLAELGDTVFIILLKKPLQLLHWYHHATVLLYCWHSYASRSSAGIWFIAMNYAVHAFMYGYFAAHAALGRRSSVKLLLRLAAPVITVMQISQMVVGVMVMWNVHKFRNEATGCAVSFENWLAGVVMYSSYFVLFVCFAVNRYCPCRRGNGKASKTE